MSGLQDFDLAALAREQGQEPAVPRLEQQPKKEEKKEEGEESMHVMQRNTTEIVASTIQGDLVKLRNCLFRLLLNAKAEAEKKDTVANLDAATQWLNSWPKLHPAKENLAAADGDSSFVSRSLKALMEAEKKANGEENAGDQEAEVKKEEEKCVEKTDKKPKNKKQMRKLQRKQASKEVAQKQKEELERKKDVVYGLNDQRKAEVKPWADFLETLTEKKIDARTLIKARNFPKLLLAARELGVEEPVIRGLYFATTSADRKDLETFWNILGPASTLLTMRRLLQMKHSIIGKYFYRIYTTLSSIIGKSGLAKSALTQIKEAIMQVVKEISNKKDRAAFIKALTESDDLADILNDVKESIKSDPSKAKEIIKLIPNVTPDGKKIPESQMKKIQQQILSGNLAQVMSGGAAGGGKSKKVRVRVRA